LNGARVNDRRPPMQGVREICAICGSSAGVAAPAIHQRNRYPPPRLGPAVSLLRPCATSAGFLATRDPPWRMDMPGLKARLAGGGYAVVIDARVVLIVRKGTPAGPVESSVYDNGKVLLKTTDRPAAEAAYADLEPHLLACRKG
jgi:hypothetical protein